MAHRTSHASPFRATVWRLLHHGCGLFGIVLLFAIQAPLIAPRGPSRLSRPNRFHPSGRGFIFGTDNSARSLLSRVVRGARHSTVTGATVAINAGSGTALLITVHGLNLRHDRLLDVLDPRRRLRP